MERLCQSFVNRPISFNTNHAKSRNPSAKDQKTVDNQQTSRNHALLSTRPFLLSSVQLVKVKDAAKMASELPSAAVQTTSIANVTCAATRALSIVKGKAADTTGGTFDAFPAVAFRNASASGTAKTNDPEKKRSKVNHVAAAVMYSASQITSSATDVVMDVSKKTVDAVDEIVTYRSLQLHRSVKHH